MNETLALQIKVIADKARQQLQGVKKEISGIASEAGVSTTALTKLSGATTALGAAALVAYAAIKACKNAINVAALGDTIKDEAQKIYMSTAAYQEWGYVLNQNGVEISTLKMGMRTFSQAVASGDSKLEKYGITSTNVSDAFKEAVYNIQNMKTESEKITAMTDLFGSRASELIPIFNMTNQETQSLMDTYRMIGGTMSNELIGMSDVLTDSILELKSSWQGLKNTLAMGVIPVLTKIVQWLTIAFAKVTIFIKVMFGIEETFDDSSTAATSMADALDGVGKSTNKLKRQLMGFDEINRLTSNGSVSSGSSIIGSILGDSSTYDTAKEGISETVSGLDKFKQKTQELSDKITVMFNQFNYWKNETWHEIETWNPFQGIIDAWNGNSGFWGVLKNLNGHGSYDFNVNLNIDLTKEAKKVLSVTGTQGTSTTGARVNTQVPLNMTK